MKNMIVLWSPCNFFSFMFFEAVVSILMAIYLSSPWFPLRGCLVLGSWPSRVCLSKLMVNRVCTLLTLHGYRWVVFSCQIEGSRVCSFVSWFTVTSLEFSKILLPHCSSPESGKAVCRLLSNVLRVCDTESTPSRLSPCTLKSSSGSTPHWWAHIGFVMIWPMELQFHWMTHVLLSNDPGTWNV